MVRTKRSVNAVHVRRNAVYLQGKRSVGRRSAKAPAKRQADTPTELLRAAERLFAARGVDSVSLREIAAAAGQANHSAALYHFSNKRELINELLVRHSDPIQAAWLVTLDHLAASGRETLE